LTARQVRILTNAAIDTMPNYDEEGDQDGQPSGHESPDPELTEADRRRHRQLMRNRNIKPNAKLAERQRSQVEVPKHKKLPFKKGVPKMGKGDSVDNMNSLLYNAAKSREFKLSDKAKRIMQLGGYK